MAEIHLANGKGIALIDDEDLMLVASRRWYLHGQGYAASRRGPRGRLDSLLLHRVVMHAKQGTEVDHVDHNKLDCRKKNLRVVTRSQNNQNKLRALRNSQTGVRGVIPYKTARGTKFIAKVQLNGKQFSRYGFITVEEANVAAMALRRKHFTHSQECAS